MASSPFKADVADIGTANIDTAAITDETVGTSDITTAAIATADITAETVGTSDITTATIGTAGITTETVGTSTITTAHITTEDVGTSTITTAHITTEDVATSTIDDLTVTTTATVFDLTVTDLATIAGENVTTSNISIANITAANIQSLSLLGSLSPADIGGSTQNNYSPPGYPGTIAIMRLTATSNATITGLAALGNGRELILYSLESNAGTITLTNQDAGSTAANRFSLPSSSSFVINPGAAIVLRYDTTGALNRWTAISAMPSTGGPITNLVVTGSVTFSGQITPASLAANANDYNPAGLATTQQIRQGVNAGVTASVTGLTQQAAGRRITLENLGPGILQLTNEDAASTAANRFTLPGSATWQMLPGGAITVLYDSTSSRWRVEDLTNCTPFQQISSILTPATISGTVNDYNPTNLATAGIIRQAFTSATLLTGLAASTNGRLLVLENIDTVFTLTLANENTNSTAANRFTLPGGGNLVLPSGASVMLVYDGTSSRWRPIGQVGATAASQPFIGQFGTGIDGDLVFDGVSNVTAGGVTMVPAAGVYTLGSDIAARNITINAGVTVRQNVGAGCRVFWTGTFTINGTLNADGFSSTNAVGATSGGSGLFNVTAGGAGSNGQGGTAGAGTSSSTLGSTLEQSNAIAASAANTPGTNGNLRCQGGTGGGGAAVLGGGGAALNAIPTSFGTFYTFASLSTGRYVGSANATNAGFTCVNLSGQGGSSGGGNGTAGGGGGGGGGAAFILCGFAITGSGAITAKGGNGGPGQTGGTGGTGGGGGGGGGTIIICYVTGVLPPTITVNGGTGGAGGNGGSANGGNGAPGRVIIANS